MFKNRNDSNIVHECTVRLLEDSDVLECEFQPFHKGSYLVEYLCQQLEIKEKDYFGLRYVDPGRQRHWLDLAKSIIKQCKDVDPILFSFRVKFYPADPFRLTGCARLMLYQQLKRDLRHGRLYCSMGEAAALGALIVQEELGDYDEEIHVENYVSSLNLALRQTDALEKKIMELHKKRDPGQDPHVAMDEFMGIARGLETYGIDPHAVKDHRGSQLYIGINHCGISTFVAGKRSQHFRWNEVHKINFEGKMFIAHLSYTDASREPKKHTIGFKCATGAACRYVWRCAIEQMLFFTLPNSQNAAVISGGGFFSWGTKFRYTGRTEREILTESINALREQKMTNSAASKRKASSVPATPSSPQGDLAQIRKQLMRNSYAATGDTQFSPLSLYRTGYSSLPRSTLSEPMGNHHLHLHHHNNINSSHHIGGGGGVGVGGGGFSIINGSIMNATGGSATVDQHGNLIYATTTNTIGDGHHSLEPVSEMMDGGGIQGVAGGASNIAGDYYFRDSVDHSSTESGITYSADGTGRIHHHHHHHHQQQHQHHGQQQHSNKYQSVTSTSNTSSANNTSGGGGGDNHKSANTTTAIHHHHHNRPPNVNPNNSSSSSSSAKNIRKFRFLHAFIPSFLFVVIAMTITAIFILESESEVFARLRQMPELVSLRFQYYEPLKQFIFNKVTPKV